MLHRRAFLFSVAGAASAATSENGEHDAWRASRLKRLQADDGWLTVTGLHWLEPGENRVPSAPGLTFTRKGRNVSVQSAGEPAMVNGEPVRRRALKKDVDKIVIGGRTYFVIERGDKVAIRERDVRSPYRTGFKGLEYFRYRPELRCEARWTAYRKPVKRRIMTIANTVEEMLAPGQAEFTIGGAAFRLEPVTEDDHLFYIFKDTTAGKSTYGAGRFMELPMPKDGVALVDFNRAYNPPCAFTPYATCPLPPRHNQLAVAIEAGEKAYHLDS